MYFAHCISVYWAQWNWDLGPTVAYRLNLWAKKYFPFAEEFKTSHATVTKKNSGRRKCFEVVNHNYVLSFLSGFKDNF